MQTVVHLGRRHGDGQRLCPQAIEYDLDDVFELRRSQDKVRLLQLERARHECRELAKRIAAGPTLGTSAGRLALG